MRATREPVQTSVQHVSRSVQSFFLSLLKLPLSPSSRRRLPYTKPYLCCPAQWPRLDGSQVQMPRIPPVAVALIQTPRCHAPCKVPRLITASVNSEHEHRKRTPMMGVYPAICILHLPLSYQRDLQATGSPFHP